MDHYKPLSKRETEVCRYLYQGYNNKTIADKMGVKQGTIGVYLRSIFGKTNTKNNIELAKMIWDKKILGV
jgi:DNA-binding NarL/FixJ family response regulator